MHRVLELEKILYQYFAYGLSIHSDIEIREFPPRETETADITIQLGHVAAELDGAEWFRSTWQAKAGHFQMDVPDVGRFLATNGNQMIIDQDANATDQEVVIYTVGSMFAALLQQRGHLTLHASSIKGPDGAVIFVGSSGMGKSTLLSAMNARGYAMIADDITALKEAEDNGIETTQLRAEKGTKPRMWFAGEAPVEIEERVPKEGESYSPSAYNIYNWKENKDA